MASLLITGSLIVEIEEMEPVEANNKAAISAYIPGGENVFAIGGFDVSSPSAFEPYFDVTLEVSEP